MKKYLSLTFLFCALTLFAASPSFQQFDTNNMTVVDKVSVGVDTNKLKVQIGGGGNAVTASNLFGGTIFNVSTYPTNIYFGTGTIFGTNGMTNVTSTTAGAFAALRLGWDIICSNCQMKVVGKNNDSNIFVMTLSGGITGGGFAAGATVWQVYPNAVDTRDVNGSYLGGIGNEGNYTIAGFSNGVVSNNGNITWASGGLNSWVEYVSSDGLFHLKSIRGASFIFDPQAGAVFDFGPTASSFFATNNIILALNGNQGAQLNLFFDNLLGDGTAFEARFGGNPVNFRVATLLGNGVSVGTVGVNANYQCFTPSFSDYSGWTYSTAFGLVFTNQNGSPTPIVVGLITGNGASITNIPPSALNGNATPHLPVAVTVGSSPFNFTNNTKSTLECYFSGSVAYSVSKNGVGVFGSLASDGYFHLQPTNTLTITYSVAPTFYTNSW